MDSDERDIIEFRIKELRDKIANARIKSDNDTPATFRLQGNIGALEWVLREFPDERHRAGCVCADCSGAELTARND